jgi:DNA (cytosine-5)-methyltransferase 1
MIPTLTGFQDKGVVLNDLRIRKLTPKECWRLMGFDDTDFEKAEKVNSNAQLYKQAGNSIVVNVLERILENLFLKEENDFEGQMNFNMLGDQ